MYTTLEQVPVLLTIDDLLPILGIGKTKAYELIRSGHLKSIRVGRQIRIPKTALEEFLRESETQTQA